MSRKGNPAPRLAAVLLALCLAAAAPPAFASTPEQEAVLATDQRSMNHPGGAFTVPETPARLRLFHPKTWQAVRLILDNVADQFRTGHAAPEAMGRILTYAPIVTNEELPAGHEWDDLLQYVLEYGIHNIYIALRETNRIGVYQVVVLFYNWDGAARWAPLAIEYDASTGWLYGTGDAGLIGIGYDYNVREYMLRSAPGTWQRSLGFNRLFDLLSPLLLIFLDTQRFPFSYGGREWMVQIWKGYYLASNGAEIGLYERDPGSLFHWNASDTMMDVTMRVYQGDRLFFEFGPQRTWWASAFKYGNIALTPLLRPRELRLAGAIAFEDPGMAEAFFASFEENGSSLITGELDGAVFRFDWAAG
jgi:hypothetical protein